MIYFVSGFIGPKLMLLLLLIDRLVVGKNMMLDKGKLTINWVAATNGKHYNKFKNIEPS